MEAVDSIRTLGHTLTGMLATRLELFSVEAQREKKRAVLLFAATGIGMGVFIITLCLLCTSIILVVPEAYRVATVLGLAATFFALSIGLMLYVYRLTKTKRYPFVNTVEELRKDAGCLKILATPKE